MKIIVKKKKKKVNVSVMEDKKKAIEVNNWYQSL